MDSIRSVSSGANQLPYSDDMHARLPLGIWVLLQHKIRVCHDIGDLGQLHEVVDTGAIVLEVKAGVLEGLREIDDGLTDVLDLFLRGDLRLLGLHHLKMLAERTNHYLGLERLVR